MKIKLTNQSWSDYDSDWFIMVHKQILQQLHRYHCAGFCIREGVMVAHEVISAGCCDGLQLMVGEPAAEVAT